MPRSRLLLIVVFLLLTLAGFEAPARVFNFSDQSLSTYLRGTFGTTHLQKEAYQPGFPSTVSFSSADVTQAWSAEFGFGFTFSKYMTARAGVELLYPAKTTGSVGSASGTALVSVDSETYSAIPQLNLEFFLKQTPNSRMYLDFGGGYAVTTIKNTVTFPSGSSLGLSNYIEEGTGWGLMGQMALGYELSLFDNVSFGIEGGYRYLFVDNYSSNRDYTGPQGTTYNGNPVTNYDLTRRTTDLSGMFAGASFRFYIH